ncbi:hypothetical protein MRX96_055394 [Rhipicephalus microplus]
MAGVIFVGTPVLVVEAAAIECPVPEGHEGRRCAGGHNPRKLEARTHGRAYCCAPVLEGTRIAGLILRAYLPPLWRR